MARPTSSAAVRGVCNTLLCGAVLVALLGAAHGSPWSSLRQLTRLASASVSNLFERVDSYAGAAPLDCMGNGALRSRGHPHHRAFSNDSWCLCRVDGLVITTQQPLNVSLYNTAGLYSLPAGSLVMYGGQTTLSYADTVTNLPEACASVDGGRRWLRLASAPLGPGDPVTTTCYDPIRGTAYLMPNSLPDASSDDPPVALLSNDFSTWQSDYFPTELLRRGGNCFAETRMGATGVWMFNGAGWLSQNSPGCALYEAEFAYKDQLLWAPDLRQYLDGDMFAPLYAARTGALFAAQYNHTSYQVDVSYVLGGSAVSNRATLQPGCVVSEETDVYDMWFSVDRIRWYRSAVSFPFQRATEANLGLDGNGLRGAVLTASPSGTLVLLGRNQRVGNTSLMASLDGGFTWAVCAVDVGFSQRDKPSIGWWQAAGKERLVVVGGVATRSDNVTAEVWVSSIDFGSIDAVAALCSLPRPTNGIIGLSEQVLARIMQEARDIQSLRNQSLSASATRMWSQTDRPRDVRTRRRTQQ